MSTHFGVPRVALVTLGRSRPGFDKKWAATMQRAAEETIQHLFDATIYPQPIVNPQELPSLFQRMSTAQIEVLIFIQPTIADGAHLNQILSAPRTIPMIFWATPERPEGSMVSSNSLVGSHLFIATLRQHGVRCGLVYGHPAAQDTHSALQEEVALIYTLQQVRCAKVGLVGGHAPGFIDLHVDPRPLAEELGAVICNIALTEFLTRFKQGKEHIEDYLTHLQRYPLHFHDIKPEDQEDTLIVQARYWALYDQYIKQGGLSALALRCWPELPDGIGHWPYLAVSCMLSEGMAVAIEGDTEGALCMLISLALTGKASYLTDWLSHHGQHICLWHGGAIPFHFCQEDKQGPIAVALHFNNRRPAVIECQVSPGRTLTLFRLWRSDGQYRACAVEGESVTPTQPLQGTLCEMQLTHDVHPWFVYMLQHGMPHHLCVAEGAIAGRLRRLCYMLNIEWVTV